MKIFGKSPRASVAQKLHERFFLMAPDMTGTGLAAPGISNSTGDLAGNLKTSRTF